MDFRERLKSIHDFLKPYQSIWQNEIMLLYPHAFADYPPHSLEELESITDKKILILLEKKEIEGIIQGQDLLSFFKRVKELTVFPSAHPALMPESPSLWRSVTLKKQHEIKRLAPLINEAYQRPNITKITDIGGGIGLLSQSIARIYELNITSLDKDTQLQAAGEKRQEKYGKGSQVVFKAVNITADEPLFLQELDKNTLSIGLHTCGPLANSQLIASAKKGIASIINLGCCYHKLFDEDQNISQFTKTHAPLIFNNFTLTLAAQTRKKMSEKDFDFKLMVKRYRYALHFLQVDLYGIKDIITYGNSDFKDYSQNFAHYVNEQFLRVGMKLNHSAEEIEDYYKKVSPIVEKMLKAGIIRDAFGRLLEAYLILDRAIFLEEEGYQVEVLEVFDEEISPRNLGIFAHSKK